MAGERGQLHITLNFGLAPIADPNFYTQAACKSRQNTASCALPSLQRASAPRVSVGERTLARACAWPQAAQPYKHPFNACGNGVKGGPD
jgi:hypothetical protein